MKINIALHFFLLFSFFNTITAQDSLPTGITFTTQKQIDNSPSESKKEIKSEKQNDIRNDEVKIDSHQPKWRFGAEVGFASVKLKKSEKGGLFDNKKEEIKPRNKSGFRLLAIAKYNIDDRFHFIGGFGIVKAKGNSDKKITDSEGGFFSAKAKTTINDNVIQNYTLIEIPVYLRWHLIGKHKAASENFNVFFDVGGSFNIPISAESSFTHNHTVTTTTTGFSFFGGSSSISTTSTYQKGKLDLQSKLSQYFAFGFLIRERVSIAFTSTGINTQGVIEKSIKYKSRLNSVSVAVYF